MLKLMPHLVDMEAVKKYMLMDTSPLSVVLLQEVRSLKIFVIFNDIMFTFIIGRTIQCSSCEYYYYFKWSTSKYWRFNCYVGWTWWTFQMYLWRTTSTCLATSKKIYVKQLYLYFVFQIYKSLKPLPAWFQDLRQRINFFNSWVESQRQPTIYWISAFSYPTAFLTAVLQRTARKDQVCALCFSRNNF
jgi:hypothetical protein